MSEWRVYGQTVTPSGQAVDNPAPNVNGLIGESTSLPYTVPAGYLLSVSQFFVEGVDDRVSMIPWVGSSVPTNAMCLPTINSYRASNDWTPAPPLQIPAGKTLNIRLVYSGTSTSTVTGWGISGQLDRIG